MAVPHAQHPAIAQRPGLRVYGLLILVAGCLPALLIASLI
tara:strand:- start:17578 stop:17697 length:120 start_codon:yes stop_codon:yes gene_type:complete